MRRHSSRVLYTVAVALAAAAASPGAAFGHAAFVGSSPGPGRRLDASPAQLSLRFTEPLNRRLSTVRLVATDTRRPVAVSVRVPSARRLEVIATAALPRGAYRVEWHTVSTVDGHALEGSYAFGVRARAVGGGQAVEQSPLARDGWLRVLARGALYAFALVLTAALLLPVLTRRARWLVPDALVSEVPVAAVRERQARLTGALAWATVLAAVTATLAEAADAASGFSPVRISDFLLASQAGAARVLVVVLFLGTALLSSRRPRASAALAVLALGAVAASGHASAASPRLPSVASDWLHLVSAGVWLGGIALLVAVWTPTLRGAGRPARLAVAREVLPPFGRVALPAFALVTTTGLVSLITELGHLSALWETGYGRVLAVKIGLVGLVAALSAGHALRLRPRLPAANRNPPERVERRHWRMLRTQPAVGLAVVAAVALLVAFPLPPRQLGEAGEAEAAVAACDPCPLPRPSADELAVADHAGGQLVAVWVRRQPHALIGTVRALDYRGRPSRGPVDVLGAETSSCGPACRRFRAPAGSDVVRVALRDAGRRYVAVLPVRWIRGADGRARRLLVRAQAAMRSLRSVRQLERVTSGPGSNAATHYVLQAPNRLRFATDLGVEDVTIGRVQWQRTPGAPWLHSRYGSGLPFRTRSWFRWIPYARAARLLGTRRDHGHRVATLALMDEATPVWFRLTIDLSTYRVLTERVATKAHFTRTTYGDFDRPQHVRPPEVDRAG